MRYKDHPLLFILLAGLATWRITNIIQKEEIASPFRKALGVFEPDGEDPDYWIYPDNFIGKVLHCFFCGSIWVSVPITILLFVFPPLIVPFALSAIAISFKEWLDRPTIAYVDNWWSNEEADQDEEDSDEVGNL